VRGMNGVQVLPYFCTQPDWWDVVCEEVAKYVKDVKKDSKKEVIDYGIDLKADTKDAKIIKKGPITMVLPRKAQKPRSDKFWVSGHYFGKDSAFGDVFVTSTSSKTFELKGVEGFEVKCEASPVKSPEWSPRLDIKYKKHSTSLFAPLISLEDLLRPIPTASSAGSKNVSRANTYPILTLDVSPYQDVGICAGRDGAIVVYVLKSGAVISRFSRRKEMGAHLSDIQTCKFFPSGKICLSSALDRKMKLWTVENGKCVKSFETPTGVVTGTSFLDKSGLFM